MKSSCELLTNRQTTDIIIIILLLIIKIALPRWLGTIGIGISNAEAALPKVLVVRRTRAQCRVSGHVRILTVCRHTVRTKCLEQNVQQSVVSYKIFCRSLL